MSKKDNKMGYMLLFDIKVKCEFVKPETEGLLVIALQTNIYMALEENDRISLTKELGEENLPRNTFYGDGQPIEIEVLNHIREVYNQEKIKFQWQKGDIMMLDNILTAHARETLQRGKKSCSCDGLDLKNSP